MKLNIVADENMEAVVEHFGDLGNVHLVPGRGLQQSDLRHADVLLVRSVTAVNAQLLDATPVQFVGTATSGFDHIDRSYLKSSGICFAHAPGSNANSVVEYVLGAIASVGQKLEQLLSGGTLGIIGYGNIGSLLARRLADLGIDFRVYDPWLDPAVVSNSSSLVEVLGCDVITLHAELTEKTPWPSYHLLGENELLQIGREALLINASRGAVVDNAALLSHLEINQGPTTILDVWEGEPLVNRQLLSRVKFGSAHIAGYSLDGKRLATRMLKAALERHLNDGSSASSTVSRDDVRPVSLPDNLTGAELLRALLHQTYQLGEDDRMLRQAVEGVSEVEAAANFDRLRKEYRTRRELYGADVNVAVMSVADLKLLGALGCHGVGRAAQIR